MACGHAFGLVHLPPATYVATWPEFARSGWGDPAAFATIDALDATVTHVLTGVIVGAVCGALGGAIGHLRQDRC